MCWHPPLLKQISLFRLKVSPYVYGPIMFSAVSGLDIITSIMFQGKIMIFFLLSLNSLVITAGKGLVRNC